METEEKNILDTIVTIFPNVTSTKEPHFIALRKILDRIRKGKSLELITKIRNEQNKKDRDKLKEKLPSICFSGKFKFRSNSGIESHSGLICLDFDHFETKEKLEKFKVELKENRYVLSYFQSPSGDGVKVLVRVPAITDDIAGTHSKYVESLCKYFKQENWDDLTDVSRVCYESFDPDVYLNETAKVYDILTKDKSIIVEHAPEGAKIVDPHEIYRRIKKWAEKEDSYHDGNKHKFLMRISAACNRYGLDPELAASKLIDSYQDKAEWVDSNDFYDIVKRVYITYENQNNHSWFTTKNEVCDFDPESKARDVIYLNDIEVDMWNSFLKGDARGETTYFKTVDDHWKWKKGEVSIMHGIPNQGKSTLTLQLMLLKSIHEGIRWGVFSPEQNPPIDFYKDLIHMYIGKSTEPYHKYKMDDKEFKKGMDFMKEHFFFVYPKNESPTPQYMSDRFEELMIKEKITGCLTDPFNQLDNDWKSAGNRDDHYISSFANKEKRFALEKNIYKLIIVHPKGGSEILTDKSQDPDLENSGNYKCPNEYDIAGGAMWFNKVDNILATYQPYFKTRMRSGDVKQGSGKSSSESGIIYTKKHPRMTQFVSQKIKKPKLIGVPGTANLIFNIKQFRYYEEEGYEEIEYHADESLIGLPKEGVYSPFDPEYREKKIRENLEEKIDATTWDKFITNKRQISEEEKIQEENSKQQKALEELGIDPMDYDYDHSADDQSWDNLADGSDEFE